MSSSNCCFLICIQVFQEVDQVVWYSHLFQNFPQFIVIHTVKGFGIVNKAETDVFLELSCFFPWSSGCWQFDLWFLCQRGRPNLSVTPGVSWLPTFAFQSPIMKRTSSLGVSSKGLVGLHRTVQLQLLSITGWGIDLDYCDIEWFALETNRDHSVVFEIASKYCISDSFVDHDGYSISSEGFLPTVADIMVIWVKFTHSSPF